MSGESVLHLTKPPIVEAVVDIDCDLPLALDFGDLEEPVRRAFDGYPSFRRLFGHPLGPTVIQTELDVRKATSAFQLISETERQLVQVRRDGFSFNRLAPYTSLDDYLPEIERTFRVFVDVVAPLQIRSIGLRYINRMVLPSNNGSVELDEYLRSGVVTADSETLVLSSFLSQYTAIETITGHEVNVTLTREARVSAPLPIIFDINVRHLGSGDPHMWENIQTTVLSLRRLKNKIFQDSLTEKCLNLFR